MRKLEAAYPDELAVIGVSSPKYTAEGDSDNLRNAVHRLGVEHPVVNDVGFRVWESYAVNAWPTLVFLSPSSQVIGQHAGEATFEALNGVMQNLVSEADRASQLDRTPNDFQMQPWSRPLSELSYPGGVLATRDSLYISDSHHHRILSTDLDGEVRAAFGSGAPGRADGAAAQAQFFFPQGMALDETGGKLYVADEENHAIRCIDLGTETVTTVAGTGTQARRVQRRGPALETSLSSPWDLSLHGTTLFIAMAGLHQIWALDLPEGMIEVWAGTGHEDIRDGSRLSAWFAQPMGVSLYDTELIVSCAETQAVRSVDIGSGMVSTLVGEGLFDFGDENGPAPGARLQHNQAVAASSDVIYIADTYNNKLKVLDRRENSVRTLAGSGIPGTLDGPGENARFDEPTSLSIFEDTLYVADTNNHAIRAVDLDSGHVRTIRLQGL